MVPDALRARALITRAELAFEQEDYLTAATSARAGLELCPRAGLSRAAALRLLAMVSMRGGDLAEAMSGVQAALAAAQADDDYWEEGLAHAARAVILGRQRDLAGAQAAYETAMEMLRDNNGWGVALALYGLGWLARSRKDYTGALHLFREALVLYRQIDARPEIARTLAGVGWVALTLGDLELTRSSLTESAQLSLATGQRQQMARIMTALGLLALAEQDPERAIRMEGAAQALRTELGRVHSRQTSTLFDAARQQLGEATADRLFAEGHAMSRGEAIRYGTSPPGIGLTAASLGGPQSGDPLATGPRSLLTPRELEIATLAALGLSNRAIADELVISPATAARHMANIFTKLGFTSRAQLAAWAVDRDPSSH
jgi:ATP/maltotriose-dependent transcriptional regulator MalT